MPISFPQNPQEGDEYTYNEKTYVFGGTTYYGAGDGGAAYNYPSSAPNGGAGYQGVVIVAYPDTLPALSISAGLNYTILSSRAGY